MLSLRGTTYRTWKVPTWFYIQRVCKNWQDIPGLSKKKNKIETVLPVVPVPVVIRIPIHANNFPNSKNLKWKDACQSPDINTKNMKKKSKTVVLLNKILIVFYKQFVH